MCWVGGSWHGSSCFLDLAVSTTQRRRAHPGPSWLGHAGGAGSHGRVHPVLAAWAVAASYRYGLAGPLAVHGAAGVHSQTVGHAGTGAAVARTASPSVVGGPRVVTWKKTAHVNDACHSMNVLHNVTQNVKHGLLSLQTFISLEFDGLLTRMTQNGCCEIVQSQMGAMNHFIWEKQSVYQVLVGWYPYTCNSDTCNYDIHQGNNPVTDEEWEI